MFTERVQSRAAARDATRRRVLTAAEELFRTQGFASTTVRQIAARAGVSAGSVMAVGDKDALLVAVFDDWIAAVHETRAAGGEPPAASNAAIMALFEPFLAYFAQDPVLSREYSSIIVRGTHESAIFDNLALALVSEIENVLARAGFAPAVAARRARVVYFAYLGIVMTAGNRAAIGGSPLEQLREVVDFALGEHNEQDR
ncbi:TetR/AcrR family transcriptional regulator [Nocardia yunnanensis]|uniref:TetR/AcrR family transcriptional regulator n=1 Tax=Nocardia yunnanensis TaxID=2382165 RepID=A0A386ZDV5_9NOCA|nr:TetR/AcrR family transcriptional regulator [Nocardia yunnanensis]AYF74805.1 TetR/AcrR family transcriptional regulator [Nocardia yunnanensis]